MRKVMFVACILGAAIVQAEPSPSVRYLMGESVSLFEWGIFRLQLTMETLNTGYEASAKQTANVEYDWPKNQLTVKVIVYPRYRSFQKATARQVCGSIMQEMKLEFGVDPRLGRRIGTFFHHQQFETTDVPKNMDADLEAITNLEVEVMASKNDQSPFQEQMSCSSELLKSETRYFTTSESR